ncbi:hypothetical protein [Aeromonas piscicola]|uniref:hypothetical protein n=1 Tax=Aeromonas piscicola TaxID=600645 RepID=UPI0021F8A578|nr:hypothetical protein [Aeromonas piscicola]MCW0507851.1 hypothetical protein [Aeromonas piscicola]
MQSQELIVMVESHPDFKPGRNGTVISLGCYSECWDESSREITTELIEYFLKKGNPVQFATKRYVSDSDLEKVAHYIQWKGQLCIFISSATISKWNKLERGTDAPELRFRSFYSASALGIPAYLYIKPVINSITINDFDDYVRVINEYPVSGVIVGKKFVEANHKNDNFFAPIGNGKLMYANEKNDEHELFKCFSKHIETHKESLNAVELWRTYAQQKN